MNETHVPAAVPADPTANTTDLLEHRVAATPDKALFAVPDGAGGWSDISAREFRDRVARVAKGLIAAGLQPGERIGFMAKTSYEWSLVDFAIWYSGAVMVPIYETSSPAQLAWNLTDSGAVGIITEDAAHAARFDEVRGELPDVRISYRLDEGALGKLEAAGSDVTDEELESRRSAAVGTDTATLIYTSGSTGRPKGTVLTHANFVELSRNTEAAIPEVVNSDGTTVLFITLAHVFARFISVLCVQAGIKVGHEPDTKKLVQALGSYQPTFLLAVPRVFEKVYNAAEQKAMAGGKGKIFSAAVHTGVEYSKALDTGHVPLGLKLKFAVLDRLVLSKLRALLGGRATHAISGSAPLGEFLGHFYRSLGLQILEGYGLTETTAPATVNRPGKFKVGTTGPAMPGTGIRIAEDGEIQVIGIPVFKEYWKNPEATAAAFTEDGWFMTGDLGSLDEDGYLKITGRKKEIIITAGGKNVAPAALEDPIRAHVLVSQVVVVGDQKPFISAFLTLDAEMLPQWLATNGLPPMNVAEAAKDPKVRAALQEIVDQANSHVSRAESIRKFTVLPYDFTIESGHLTPKLSIKRHVILADLADEIEAIYSADVNTGGLSVAG
ncbi:AMP-dependent synthetase/ligase [Agromyces seonyuensis]|uniref:Acyl-CoA synthetase n=1 Tax=Agromyces seonyuensis TaxID=2662446 RepID=A0A6I4NW39_9MICO|nr:AMP-dependent synthetase/ligase [Agromyces seonyuensis]MWB98568.1 AMP-binding protein [Agromyces seonyuensis]